MEGVVKALFGGQYHGCKVLVTGHTGFKGSWLVLWLKMMGADVSGIALDPPTSPNHWQLLNLDIDDYRQDICDAEAMVRSISAIKPEIVFHLAAQPLVFKSYKEPLMTWATNVQGTANILEACRHTASVKAIVVVTSDKCYQNIGAQRGYHEQDRLGGHDPYSASKAAVELLAESYRMSYFDETGSLLLATARAGNVIGGGDWSEDRLISDLVRAVSRGEALTIRSPYAVRPWQHVLDALAGYLLLGQHLLEGDRSAADAWNFGPDLKGSGQVVDVLHLMKKEWVDIVWQVDACDQVHEESLLHIDSGKAKQHLGWRPVWGLPQSIRLTSEWYESYLGELQVRSVRQLEKFTNDARQRSCNWAG